MMIHIVTSDYKNDNIIGRLARALADGTGWSISDSVYQSAEINYFFPYLEHRPCNTQSGVWFTHKEDSNRRKKLELWDSVAGEVNYRVTSAKIYQRDLQRFGRVSLVRTPLDTEKFRPAKRPEGRYIRFGFSGYVYPGGRKGEDLAGRLADDIRGIQWCASGRGWPCQTKNYDYADLQKFFQSLDLYICTSTIEGIGYPVLESLSCGIPVLIPRGVGVFDELPEHDFIFRYKSGDYNSLKTATSDALKSIKQRPGPHDDLRATVSAFTMSAWIEGHMAALQPAKQIKLDSAPVICDKEWINHSGIYYVAFGGPAMECAKRAILSAQKYLPNIPTALASNEPLGVESVFIDTPDKDIGGRAAKIDIYDNAPRNWQHVLYLDADTEIVSSAVYFLLELLANGYDFFICLNPGKYVTMKEAYRPDNKVEIDETIAQWMTGDVLQFNGGVFGFTRNERTRAFFASWRAEWERYGKRDQGALLRALRHNPMRMIVLNNAWNTVTRYCDPATTAGILHYPMEARRWKGTINGRLDSTEAWASLYPEVTKCT